MQITDYVQAVALAKQGHEEAFDFLYENTYRDKYFIALKYMGNEVDAQDVIQDAYVKAFTKLDTLSDAGKFPSWMGMIVANTAKNALEKKRPLFFSDLSPETDEGEAFEYQIEDDNLTYQPEQAYMQQETVEMVHALLGTLSDEQRMCILMFYLEGQSIREIATNMGCSENTVKSRLNYGRKNLREEAENLQKKGYKLYSTAPIPLLLYLLSLERDMYMPSGVASGGARLAQAEAQRQAGKNGVRQLSKAGTDIAKKSLFQGATAQAIAGIAGGVVLLGLTAGVLFYGNQKQGNRGENQVAQVAVTAQQTDVVTSEPLTEPVTEPETEEPWVDVKLKDLPDLLQGGVSKEQLKFLLAYSPSYMKDAKIKFQDLCFMYFSMCRVFKYNDLFQHTVDESYEPDGASRYSISEIDRVYSVITDYKIAKHKKDFQKEKSMGLIVKKNHLLDVNGPTDQIQEFKTKIQSIKRKSNQIKIRYQVRLADYMTVPGCPKWTETREAILYQQKNGKYQIREIHSLQNGWIWAYFKVLDKTLSNLWSSKTKSLMGDSIYIYKNPSGDKIEVFSNQVPEYQICDVDGDSIPELIVTVFGNPANSYNVYTYDKKKGAVLLGCYIDTLRSSVSVDKKKKRLIVSYWTAYDMDVAYVPLAIKNGKLKQGKEFTKGVKTEEMKYYKILNHKGLTKTAKK